MTHTTSFINLNRSADKSPSFEIHNHLLTLVPPLSALFKKDAALRPNLTTAIAAAAQNPAFGWDLECALVRLDLNPYADDASLKISSAFTDIEDAGTNAMDVQFGKASIGEVNQVLLELLEQHDPTREGTLEVVQQAREALTL